VEVCKKGNINCQLDVGKIAIPLQEECARCVHGLISYFLRL
jgi:hypothetical protein